MFARWGASTRATAFRVGLAAVVGLWAMACAVPVAAQGAEAARYTLTLSGVTAGRMTLAATVEGNGYALTSNAASAGLAGVFGSFSLTTRANGAVRGGGLIPQRYVAQAKTARDGRETQLVFQDGVARVTRTDPLDPDAPVVDPARHRGALDPLSGFYTVLRDTGAAQACQLDFTMFDGQRISRVTLASPMPEGDGMTCQGVYRRVAGYPPRELAKRASFAFEVTYRPVGDGMLRVASVSMDSLFGPARLTRED